MTTGFFNPTAIATAKPAPLTPRCGACGLLKHCDTPKMPLHGRGRKQILLVGERPTVIDDARGRPFIDDNTDPTRRILDKIGIDIDEDCWATNAIICSPQQKRAPTNDEVSHCRPALLKTIREKQPVVIVPFGSAAVRAVVGHLWREDIGSVDRWVGWRIPDRKLNAWVCPIWGPEGPKDERNKEVQALWFERYLTKALERHQRPWKTPPDHTKEVELIFDPAEAAKRLDAICGRYRGMVAFDYETNMLKPEGGGSEIVSCAVTWGENGKPKETIAYPWVGAAVEATKRVLLNKAKKIAANMKFEERWSVNKLGVRVRNWYWDTMQVAHIIDNRPGITSLKFYAYTMLGQPEYDAHITPYFKAKTSMSKNRIREIDLGALLLYNGLDALLEFYVAMRQIKIMKGGASK